ncbi:hypothetical protein A2276_02050 [candidate division WOR-1 bacterium RIFOXYA12_FULL_43_27]|uniref:TRASH domain-containing protein n=1 Tax=candidate division WOR-1 bacterium RIFOXYC2_FULL_46_14 TaxID=1802587 RepID=A0A1F4U6M0_UNCSA|nr:MAG: hypothetical protein A2276_02050 [candidate division WOR-1 bacterium RIFOXYA12_FULL_43_27]OGC19495.1 MAG: hypothetical protein A2292_02280 [candidate division WOR-1 bacterium RIFOXYB2_FULL_46_45]OGC30483.1 MAG: hypothetical protein A2232_02280 [candidate division WOR-1 bacterium RIFOXYA2_FULL_46_56]OGC40551.1 MAG: hypothetical protein A2438_05995 [candidate division WOR-1 bacterium RIFOXYC2_FULL_46_14]
MKNIIIGLVVVLVILAAWWYFGVRPSRQMMGDDVVECPVMGTKMNKSEAYSSTEYKGKTYYFCCAACPGAFRQNPEKYINKQ